MRIERTPAFATTGAMAAPADPSIASVRLQEKDNHSKRATGVGVVIVARESFRCNEGGGRGISGDACMGSKGADTIPHGRGYPAAGVSLHRIWIVESCGRIWVGGCGASPEFLQKTHSERLFVALPSINPRRKKRLRAYGCPHRVRQDGRHERKHEPCEWGQPPRELRFDSKNRLRNKNSASPTWVKGAIYGRDGVSKPSPTSRATEAPAAKADRHFAPEGGFDEPMAQGSPC
jgi:hypothetical protein